MHETEGQKKLIFSLLVFIFSSSNVRVIAPLLLDVLASLQKAGEQLVSFLTPVYFQSAVRQH